MLAGKSVCGALALIALAGAASAQSAGPQLPPVTVRPAPGSYSNTTSVTLDDADPAAQIHYTWDGSAPTAASPTVVRGQVLFIAGVYDGEKGLTKDYTLRAIATKPGSRNSEPVTFHYTVARRDRTAYLSEEVLPGVRMIRDSDNDKMFLIKGSRAFALIDSGQGTGKLKDYIRRFTGSMPIIVLFTHSHGDHIGQADQFIADSDEYIETADKPATVALLKSRGVSDAVLAAHLKTVEDGSSIDIGDRKLEIYAVAGHTPGSIVILDPKTGNLFSGDTLGNNSFLPPDVMWMQFDTRALDAYLANELTMRAKIGSRISHILTGHNDHPLTGTAYLDHLETAFQRLMDQGDAALIASWRPQGMYQVVVGDRYSDPNWFGANVERKTYLPAKPDQIAGLIEVTLRGAHLRQNLDPAVHQLTAVLDHADAKVTIAARPTSSRSRGLTIGGVAAVPGKPVSIASTAQPVAVVVTAPDGVTTATYTLRFQAK